jgi:hypothetical protein
MKKLIVLLGSFALLVAPVLVAADDHGMEVSREEHIGRGSDKRLQARKNRKAKKQVGNRRKKGAQQEGVIKRGFAKAKSMLGFGKATCSKGKKVCKPIVKTSQKGHGRKSVGARKEKKEKKSQPRKAGRGKRGRPSKKGRAKAEEAEEMAALE